jgi:nucleotide-binding universal stress UspA family protein
MPTEKPRLKVATLTLISTIKGNMMKILLPIDGSKSSLNAAKYVATMAKNSRSPTLVTLISVHDDAGLGHVKQFVAKSVVDDYLREVSEKELKAAQKILDVARIKHNMVIKRGHIAEEILALANKEKVDIIVMGAKGRSGFVDILMGSVAQRISSSAKQPVLLIK